MKYLGLHKVFWFLLVLLGLFVEIMFICIVYILYVIWTLRWPKANLWYSFHDHRSRWDGEWIKDRNPWQTLVRRYNVINSIKKE